MRRQQRNLDEFARGYIKTDPDWTKRMWCNWAFHKFKNVSREELHLQIISLLNSDSINSLKNVVKVLNNNNVYGNNNITTST